MPSAIKIPKCIWCNSPEATSYAIKAAAQPRKITLQHTHQQITKFSHSNKISIQWAAAVLKPFPVKWSMIRTLNMPVEWTANFRVHKHQTWYLCSCTKKNLTSTHMLTPGKLYLWMLKHNVLQMCYANCTSMQTHWHILFHWRKSETLCKCKSIVLNYLH